MNDQRIAIWQTPFSYEWIVNLEHRNWNTLIICGEFIERIAICETHAEAIEAARDWIKANPLVVEPKAAA